MRRIILINVLVVLAIVVIASVVGYLLYNNYYFYSTDDAQVTGKVVNIVPTMSGTLNSLTVQIGDYVSANQVIGTVQITGSNAIANLTAPFSGLIVQVPGVVGQTVTPEVAVALEVDPSSVNVTAYVDESAIKSVSVGQFVEIHVDAYSNTSFTGQVSQIVGAAAGQFSLLPTQDNASGNFTKVSQRIPVIVTLDSNPGQALMPGMSAEVKIHLH
jgi:multidrug resistance efflux pump